jgi:SOS-response transcriptional repressor LexA
VYDFIRKYIEAHGYGPTYREIVAECHISKNHVANYLDKLVKRKLIEYEPSKLRSIRLKEVPSNGERKD